MKSIINSLKLENKFEFYSSFFRIFISIHLIKDLIISWTYKDLLYQSNGFYIQNNSYLLDFFGIQTSFIRENFSLFYFFYMLLIILYFFGIGKNITALVLFVFYEFLQSLCPIILNGGDNLLKFIMLYMIFINSYKYFSINKSNNSTPLNNLITNLAGYSICIHLCLAYFFSAIHKIHADVWFNGIATYYTLSLERFRGTSFNLDLAKNGFLVTISTYITILIELSYPFLIWFKRTKLLMIISAILLHVSIYVLMMIYDFQLVFIFVQGFFLSNRFWLNFVSNIKMLIYAKKN